MLRLCCMGEYKLGMSVGGWSKVNFGVGQAMMN